MNTARNIITSLFLCPPSSTTPPNLVKLLTFPLVRTANAQHGQANHNRQEGVGDFFPLAQQVMMGISLDDFFYFWIPPGSSSPEVLSGNTCRGRPEFPNSTWKRGATQLCVSIVCGRCGSKLFTGVCPKLKSQVQKPKRAILCWFNTSLIPRGTLRQVDPLSSGGYSLRRSFAHQGFTNPPPTETTHDIPHAPSKMIPLVPTLVLAFLSFTCSVFVILRIVIPILPSHPLSRSTVRFCLPESSPS